MRLNLIQQFSGLLMFCRLSDRADYVNLGEATPRADTLLLPED